MSVPPRRAPRLLPRLACCALVLGAGLGSVPALAAATVATPVAAPTRLKPAQPKPRKRTASGRSTLVSRLKNRVPVTRRPPADTVPALPALPTFPSILALLGGSPDETALSGPTNLSAAVTAAPLPAPAAGFSLSAERLLSGMMARARSQLGTRYVFGGTAPGLGLDCSAFARFAMEALGIQLPRTAAQQARVGTPVPRDRSLLRPGDLLTFGRGQRVSHVGIYLGEGRFIHASVSSGQIIETTIERNRQLFRRWQGARRLIADAAVDTAGRSF